MASSLTIFLPLIAFGLVVAQGPACDPVDPPPRDPTCRWEGIRDPQTNCIVDYDCVPTVSLPALPAAISDERNRQSEPCRFIRRPKVGEQQCEEWEAVRIPSGCVVAYDCVRKKAVETPLVPAIGRPECPKKDPPPANPDCLGFDVFKDSNGCVFEYRCIPQNAKFEPVTAKPLPTTRKPVRETPVVFETSEPFPELERPKFQFPSNASADSFNVDNGQVAPTSTAAPKCKEVKRPSPDPKCLGFRQIKDDNGCLQSFECIPIGSKWKCPKVPPPPFNPICLGYEVKKDGNACITEYVCIEAEPSGNSQNKDLDKEKSKDVPTKVGCKPIKAPACKLYHSVMDDQGCVLEFECVPDDDMDAVTTNVATIAPAKTNTELKSPAPSPSAPLLREIHNSEVPKLDVIDTQTESSACISKQEPDDQPDCKKFQPVKGNNGCVIDYICTEKVEQPKSCNSKPKPVKSNECDDFTPVFGDADCVVNWKCIPANSTEATTTADSIPEACNPAPQPLPNNVCIVWEPVQDASGCIARWECVPETECKNEPDPPSSEFCRRYVPWRDLYGCVRRWFCVPVLFPAHNELRQASTKCSDIFKPEPNRQCESWEPIVDQVSGCIQTYGCIARPVPECPPTKIPEPDDKCVEWKPIEDERFCIKEYICVIRETPVTCSLVEPPVSTDCTKWNSIQNDDGCIISFECLSSLAGNRPEKKPDVMEMVDAADDKEETSLDVSQPGEHNLKKEPAVSQAVANDVEKHPDVTQPSTLDLIEQPNVSQAVANDVGKHPDVTQPSTLDLIEQPDVSQAVANDVEKHPYVTQPSTLDLIEQPDVSQAVANNVEKHPDVTQPSTLDLIKQPDVSQAVANDVEKHPDVTQPNALDLIEQPDVPKAVADDVEKPPKVTQTSVLNSIEQTDVPQTFENDIKGKPDVPLLECLVGNPPDADPDCKEWRAEKINDCIVNYVCIPHANVLEPEDIPLVPDQEKDSSDCAFIEPPQGNCDDWRIHLDGAGCIIKYDCMDNAETDSEGDFEGNPDIPIPQENDIIQGLIENNDIGCIPLVPPREDLYPECVSFRQIKDVTGCTVDYQCLFNDDQLINTVAPTHLLTVEETRGKCDPPQKPLPTPQCADYAPIFNKDGCPFNFECLASPDVQAKLIAPEQYAPQRQGEGWIQPQSHNIGSGPSADWQQQARPQSQWQNLQPAQPSEPAQWQNPEPAQPAQPAQWQNPQPAQLAQPAQWQNLQAAQPAQPAQWQNPQSAQAAEAAQWQNPQPAQPAQPAPWENPQLAQPAQWQNPQPAQPDFQPAQVYEPAPQPQAPWARPVESAGYESARGGQFQPGPRADGQSPACASVPVPPTNYRCAGWSPEYDEETGCIDHYECIPAPPVPPIPPPRPCKFVPKPKHHELCRWTARIEPRTGCKAYYECRPVNTPGSFCPVVPYPRPVSRCEWNPVINRDTGCVITYRCALIPDCPNKLGEVPAAKDGCIWTVVTDEKGCDSEYKCLDHAGKNDAGIAYAKTSGQALIKEVPPCDPRDPHVCTGWREPMEWGCCARYRDFPQSYFRWHNRGCYCEPNRRRCVIERSTPGKSVNEANDQWTYCVPKETFDCYNKYFLKGALCDS